MSNKQIQIVVLITTAVVLLGTTQECVPASISPVADGGIYWNNADGRFEVYPDHWAMAVRPPHPSNGDEFRAAIEFSMSSVPANLAESTLWLNVLSTNRMTVPGSRAAVYAYSGNGSVGSDDFSENQYSIGSFDLPPNGGSTIDVAIDVLSAVQFAQGQQWAYIGFMVSTASGSEYFQVNLGSLETPESTVTGWPARLEFEPIPEPATLALLVVAGAVLLRRHFGAL